MQPLRFIDSHGSGRRCDGISEKGEWPGLRRGDCGSRGQARTHAGAIDREVRSRHHDSM